MAARVAELAQRIKTWQARLEHDQFRWKLIML
jgi:hypothetical protein